MRSSPAGDGWQVYAGPISDFKTDAYGAFPDVPGRGVPGCREDGRITLANRQDGVEPFLFADASGAVSMMRHATYFSIKIPPKTAVAHRNRFSMFVFYHKSAFNSSRQADRRDLADNIAGMVFLRGITLPQ